MNNHASACGAPDELSQNVFWLKMLSLKYAAPVSSGTTTHEATSADPPKTTAARPRRGSNPRHTTITNTPIESSAKYPVR